MAYISIFTVVLKYILLNFTMECLKVIRIVLCSANSVKFHMLERHFKVANAILIFKMAATEISQMFSCQSPYT